MGVGVIISTSISWTAPSILFMNFAAAANNFDCYYSGAIAATTFIFSSARQSGDPPNSPSAASVWVARCYR